MVAFCANCNKYVNLTKGGCCSECGKILAGQSSMPMAGQSPIPAANQNQIPQGKPAETVRYCHICCANVRLTEGGRCPQCGTILEYRQTNANIRNLINNVRPPIQSNHESVSPNSESGQKTTGMLAWEVIGIIVGLVFFIVGFVNVVKSNENITVAYDPVTKAIYGLYMAIGSALVIFYSHKWCQK